MNTKLHIILIVAFAFALQGCKEKTRIQSGDLLIEFNDDMYTRINSVNETTNEFMSLFQLSEFIETKDFKTNGFPVRKIEHHTLNDNLGTGTLTRIKGEFKQNGICMQKIVEVTVYDEIEDLAFFNVYYVNCGSHNLLVKKWTNHSYYIRNNDADTVFWSFQGSSSSARKDWVRPVAHGYYNRNYMGMNQSDYGGGIPVTDIWRRDGGLAIGQTELVPKEISLPVYYSRYKKHAQVALEKEFPQFIEFQVNDTLQTLHSFVSVHKGDYYITLKKYSDAMQKKGIHFVESEPAAFEPIWCGWGYGRLFTKEEIIGTLPKVKKLGIKWAVIDDGFQIAEGDWRVNKQRFPGGSKDMKEMVEAIHAQGLKAKLWWAPLAADPGSKVLQDDPDVLLINESGSPQYISWWDSWYMSPVYQGTLLHTKETIEMFLSDWNFDGLKLDGQHMNAVPAEHNWSRPLEYPEKSIEELPEFFKFIYETSRDIKPNAVIENCPCGTCMSFYNMPYANQTVSSDPTSSWQIRLKGKTYKAIMPQTAYYGDHVELSDGGNDFASSFGIGAVLGTKFTWPKPNPNPTQGSFLLTAENELIWKKWFALYNQKMLSKGEYLGELYDIGFDIPEGHVIRKADTLFYAFYNDRWEGPVELRGLENKTYKVVDYVNEKELGTVEGPTPVLEVPFTSSLLIEVYPE